MRNFRFYSVSFRKTRLWENCMFGANWRVCVRCVCMFMCMYLVLCYVTSAFLPLYYLSSCYFVSVLCMLNYIQHRSRIQFIQKSDAALFSYYTRICIVYVLQFLGICTRQKLKLSNIKKNMRNEMKNYYRRNLDLTSEQQKQHRKKKWQTEKKSEK